MCLWLAFCSQLQELCDRHEEYDKARLRWNSRPYSECMLSLHIGYMKFLFLKLFIIIFSLGNYPFLRASVPIVDVISKHFKQKQDKVEQQ